MGQQLSTTGRQSKTTTTARRRVSGTAAPPARRPPRYDPNRDLWNNDGSMFFWLRACREDEGYKNTPECFKTRKAMPWPFPRNHYKLTKPERVQRIFPGVDCAYDNLRRKPACDKLLKRVNSNTETMRRKGAATAAAAAAMRERQRRR